MCGCSSYGIQEDLNGLRYRCMAKVHSLVVDKKSPLSSDGYQLGSLEGDNTDKGNDL